MEAPLTRKENQARTRERLLEVASEVFVEDGYSVASLERIAERAGYSKGAVYSNFSGKEELVLAVLDRHFLHRLDDLQAALLAAPETVEARVGAFAGWWEEMVRHEAWGVLIMEVASTTRDRPEFQALLAQREQRIIWFATTLVDAEVERFGLDLPMTSQEIASTLVSLGSGLSFSRMLDPSIPTHVVSQVAHLMLTAPPAPPT